MNKKKKHIHCRERDSVSEKRCSCGVYMCKSLKPNKSLGCTLKQGHEGPHMNEHRHEAGTWD